MPIKVAHLTTIDLSLRYLVLPQLLAVVDLDGEAIGISADGPYVDELESLGIRHISLPGATRSVNPLADLRAALALWTIVRRERPDVLHTHTPKPGLYGRVVGRLAGVPAVLNTIHGLYATPDDPVVKRTLVYALEAFAARFSDRELVQSAEDFELVTRGRITRPNRTILLGNGVDLDRFEPSRAAVSRNAIREELGVHDGQIVVGMVGRLVAEKGYGELFEAAATLDDRFVVVVIGPHEPDKADAIATEEVAAAQRDGVRFLGMRGDVDALYGAMDVFVLPSHREGFPRAAMEAAASGLPLIASNIRGCREVVEDHGNGLLVPVRDAEALAAAITWMGDQPDERRRMAAAGRQKAERGFDERTIVETVLGAQIRVLREKGTFTRIGDDRAARVRRAETRDVPIIARLHADGISTGFLPRLGVRFLSQLYHAMLSHPASLVLVADDGFGPVGFVAGTADVDELYRFFARKRGLRAASAAGRRLMRPSVLLRAWETWRYDADHHDTPAELLSMAVAPAFRGNGIGAALGSAFLSGLAGRRAGTVKVVVGADNGAAISAYRSMGFDGVGTVEVHAGEESLVMLRGQES
jgi:glycosyltransferase involved in cell wall biosynthesis/ribosomal protein S18 acetylase RimI-like enzyme